MYAHLQPLRSSPSTTFAERPNGTSVSYEDFTTPRAAPQRESVVDRMRAHSRKISSSLTMKPVGYQSVQQPGEGSEHEMKGLVTGGKKGGERRKESGSGESFLTGTGTGDADADSGKEFNRPERGVSSG